MTQFNFLSLELMLAVVVIMTYTRYRKNNILSLAMVAGLTVYCPPSQADFEEMQESIKPPVQRENAKGKKNKFDGRKSKSSQ